MTIFKQYGEQRAGTNYLKRMLEVNFTDTTVFGSVLGWKHGMFELANGYASPSAVSHEDWVRQNLKDGKVFSVDNYPLPYPEHFLLDAAKNLNYLISYKPMLPWIDSMKRFRFPKRPYEEAHVTGLLERYIANYRAWLRLPNVLVVHHDILIHDGTCTRLLEHMRQRYGLVLRTTGIVLDKKVVKASTDHGLLLTDSVFEPDYYASQQYMAGMPAWVIELSQQERFSTQFIEEAAWQPCHEGSNVAEINYFRPSAKPKPSGDLLYMPRLCTLAVGKEYEMLALQLRASLPVEIAIYDLETLSSDGIVFPPRKGFNFHCKRIPIEREYHPFGTLFLDADTVCMNQDTFRLFLAGLAQLETGIHAVFSYNAYGAVASDREGSFVSGLSAGNIQKDKLSGKMEFFSNVFPMTEEDLIEMIFPVEWFLFCKFNGEAQKDAFFDRWKLLEENLLGSNISYLGGECYAIGMAARHAGVPIKKLGIKAALNHKNFRII